LLKCWGEIVPGVGITEEVEVKEGIVKTEAVLALLGGRGRKRRAITF